MEKTDIRLLDDIIDSIKDHLKEVRHKLERIESEDIAYIGVTILKKIV